MKATKKILGASVALVAAVAVSAGSTFAWFTSNQSISVGQVEANVVTLGGDLQIGLVSYEKDGGATVYVPTTDYTAAVNKWGYSLGTQEDTSSPLSTLRTALSNTKLGAVTSTNGTAFTYNNTGSSTVSATANSNDSQGSYIQFTVALRSTTAMKVYLAHGSSVTSSLPSTATATTIAAWANIAKDTYGSHEAITIGSNITADAKNAARVSFGVGSTADASATAAAKIWAPYESFDVSYTSTGATPTTEDASATYTRGGISGVTASAGYYKGNLSADYYYNNTGVSYNQVVYQESDLIAACAENNSNENQTGGNVLADTSLLTTLTAGTISYVTIRLWIEGSDGDCINSIFSQQVSLNLALYGVDE